MSDDGETYTVQEGDTLVSIAHAHGYRAWETIWEHEQNAGLRAERADPQVLHPGDEVHLPKKTPRQLRCRTNQLHSYRVKTLKCHLRIRLEDGGGEPFADREYELTVEGETLRGRTDADGFMHEDVPLEAKTAELKLYRDPNDATDVATWTLNVGKLNPVSEVSGVQARLNNLGYRCGAEDGEIGEKTQAALKSFQINQGLPTTGELDDATRAALDQAHQPA